MTGGLGRLEPLVLVEGLRFAHRLQTTKPQGTLKAGRIPPVPVFGVWGQAPSSRMVEETSSFPFRLVAPGLFESEVKTERSRFGWWPVSRAFPKEKGRTEMFWGVQPETGWFFGNCGYERLCCVVRVSMQRYFAANRPPDSV